MATIYEKLPASGERCLILGEKESLLYTFQFDDWKELRFSAFVSITSTGLNDPAVNETFVTSGLSDRKFYFGFKDSGNLFPNQAGSLFAGLVGSSNFDIALSSYTRGVDPVDIYCYSGSNVLGFKTAGAFNGFAVPLLYVTGNTGFAGYNQITLRKLTGHSGLVFFDSSDIWSSEPNFPANITNVSQSFMRARNNSAPLNTNFCISGFFPPELNSLFIYWPLRSNKLRIHSLICEKLK